MTAVVGCPKCKTRLKLSSLPTESKKVQCPQCKTFFMVSAPKSATPAAAAAPRKQPAAPPLAKPRRASGGGGKGKLVAVAAVLLLAVGGGLAWYLTRDHGQHDNSDGMQTAEQKDKGNVPPPPENPTKKPAAEAQREYAEHMAKAGKAAQAGNYKDAAQEYAEALQLMPEDKDAKQGKVDAESALAAQELAKKAEDKARTDVTEWIKQGNDSLAKRQYAAALELFKIAIQKSPSDPDAKNGLTAATEAMARAAEEQKRLADQQAAEKKRIDDQAAMDQKKLDDYTAALASAQTFLTTKNYAEAYQKAVFAQGLFPNDADAMAKAGEIRKLAEQGLAGLSDQDDRKKQFTQLMDQGGAALKNNRPAEAEQVYRQALALFPDDPSAAKGIQDAQQLSEQFRTQFQSLMATGNQALANGQYADAVNAFRQAVQLFPENSDAATALNNAQQALDRATAYTQAMMRAAVAMNATNYPAAIAAYSDALAVVPNDPNATLGLQTAQQFLAAYLIARQDFDNKVAQAIPLLRLQDYADASLLLNSALQVLPSHPNYAYTQQLAIFATSMANGQQATPAKRYADAVASYNLAVNAVAPLSPPLTNDLFAQFLLFNGQKALTDAQAALANATQGFNTNFAQGTANLQQLNYPAASNSFAAALNAFPYHPQAPQAQTLKQYADSMNQGQLAMNSKAFANAVVAYANALQAVPNDPPATQALANAQKLLQASNLAQAAYNQRLQQANQLIMQRKYADALNLFNEAMQIITEGQMFADAQKHAKYADAMAKAEVAVTAKKYMDAVTAYQNALAAVPGDTVAQQELQKAQQALDGIQTARKDFDAKVQLGNSLLKQQKYAEASQAFANAVALQPKDPQAGTLQNQIRYANGMAKGTDAAANKNYADAIKAFADALVAFPKDAAAQKGIQDAQQAQQNIRLAKTFDAKVQQGNTLLAQKSFMEASRQFHDALKLMPMNAQAQAVQSQAQYADSMAQALSAMNSKSYNNAVAAYNQALKAMPNDAVAQQGLQNAQQALQNAAQAKLFDNNVALANVFLGQKKYAEAGKLLNAALQAMPMHPQAAVVQKQVGFADAMLRARTAMTAQSYADAVTAYNEALKAVPADKNAQQGLQTAQQGVQSASAAQAALAKDFDAKVQQGTSLLGQKKYAEASKMFQAALKEAPANPQAAAVQNQAAFADAMVLGQSAMAANNYAGAVAAFSDAAKAMPSDANAQQFLQSAQQALQGANLAKVFDAKVQQANTLLAEKKYAEALGLFNEAIKAVPKHPQVPMVQTKATYADAMSRAGAAMNAKDYANALAAYNEAMKVYPSDLSAQQGQQSAQKAINNANLAKGFDTKVEQANALLAQKKYGDASLLFNEALKEMPKHPQADQVRKQAHYADAMVRAAAAMTAQNFSTALTAYGDALKNQPADPAAQQGLQEAQLALRGVNAAKDFAAKVQLGNTQLGLKKYADAGKYFRDAIKLMPADPQVATLQARAQYAEAMNKGQSAMTFKNYANAVTAYNDALKAQPGDADAQQGLTDAQSAQQNAGAAKDYNNKVQQGRAFLKLHKYTEASQQFNDAIKLMPNNSQNKDVAKEARYADAMSRGQAAMAVNVRDFREAVRQFQAALVEFPNDLAATAALNQAKKQAK